MIKVIGVRFRNSGKVYYFDPQDMQLRNGEPVIVETARGVECGSVVLSPREVAEEYVVQPLKPIMRKATEEDIQKDRDNREEEKNAHKICREKIAEHGLDMKLIKSEYTFDKKKLVFYFTADGRVDFRELVKDLASVFRTRIELRQIGVRDETKLLGGIGICGRPLCCSTFLSDFSSVSIKMAKEQNLSLNPTKISGACGRLMCCLKNEQETYEYLNKNLPGVGDIVTIHGTDDEEDQQGEVQAVNVLRQSARVIIEVGDDKEMKEYPADRLEVFMTRRKKNKERAKERERLQKEKKEQKEREEKERREHKEQKGRKEPREPREPREHREPGEPREQRESREPREPREHREPKEPREPREPREQRESREPREQREHREPKEPKEPIEQKEQGDKGTVE